MKTEFIVSYYNHFEEVPQVYRVFADDKLQAQALVLRENGFEIADGQTMNDANIYDIYCEAYRADSITTLGE